MLCVQGLLASVHVDVVLGREDTRAEALRWVRENVPPGAPLVVEPFVPASWQDALQRPLWPVPRPFQAYEKRLRVRQIEAYRRKGFCWVIVGSTQKQRGLKAGLTQLAELYRALDAASEETVRFSPFRPGSRRSRILLRQLLQLPPARLRAPRPGRRDPPAARLHAGGRVIRRRCP